MGARSELGVNLFKINDYNLYPIIVLPSSGDNAYPGVIKVDDEIRVSYYSSDSSTSIYLARVKW